LGIEEGRVAAYGFEGSKDEWDITKEDLKGWVPVGRGRR